MEKIKIQRLIGLYIIFAILVVAWNSFGFWVLFRDNNSNNSYLITRQTEQAERAFPPSLASAAGDIVEFGIYDWRVLEVRDGKALLLSEDLIEERLYHDENIEITWADSDMRAYLNGEFLDSFNTRDRSCIEQVRNSNEDNQWYGALGGEDTGDYIFLLSLEEVVQYFGDSGQLANRPQDGEYGSAALYIDDEYNEARIAYDKSYGTGWWLRSPGDRGSNVASVSYNGRIMMWGYNSSSSESGVRPALWLDLGLYEATPLALQPNEILKFGGYQWRVLEVSDGKLLLLSEYAFETRAYHGVWRDDLSFDQNLANLTTTWAESDMRAYLNGPFLESFRAEERERIAPTSNSTQDNQWYGTPGGEDSEDYIFLLSVEEVVQYFGDSGLLANPPAIVATSGEIDDQYNEARKAFDGSVYMMWETWWLRSPGEASYEAARVNGDGYIDMKGNFVDSKYPGVRPALWLKQ
jgi:hypothetical protein